MMVDVKPIDLAPILIVSTLMAAQVCLESYKREDNSMALLQFIFDRLCSSVTVTVCHICHWLWRFHAF